MFITIEAGINANADLFTAYEMMDLAKESGADAVKFQTWKEGLFPDIEQYRFSYDDFRQIFSYAKNIGLTCYSTPFDFKSIDFLDMIGQEIWKIPSGKVRNIEYLKYIASINPRRVILSTGLSNLGDVINAMEIIKDCKDITILQCTTQYPARYKDVNLRGMETLRKIGYPVGLSDHSIGIEIPIAACALGAVMLEKHFTLGKKKMGPDHAMSIEPDELMAMVSGIRNIEAAMGGSNKMVTPGEYRIAGEIWSKMEVN